MTVSGALPKLSWTARVFLTALAALALLNVSAGIVLGMTRPQRAIDLIQVWDWCREWLLSGQNLYNVPDSATDYPPQAIVWFSPIAFISAGWLLPLWTLVSVALTFAVSFVIARATASGATLVRTTTAALLFLCWAGVRNFLQFTQLSMVLAFVAVLLADSRPLAGGVALAVALAKPHVAVAILFSLLADRRLRAPMIAITGVVCGVAVYSWRVGSSLWSVVGSYVHVLGRLYTGADSLQGRTSLQPWIVGVAGPRWGDPLWIAAAVALLIVPCALAAANRRGDDPRRRATVRALFCVWALLSAFQLAHNFFLFLPAFTVLVLIDHTPTRRGRYVVAGVLTTALTIDLPVRLAPFLSPGMLLAVVSNLDRLLAVATFLYLIVLWVRLAPVDKDLQVCATAQ